MQRKGSTYIISNVYIFLFPIDVYCIWVLSVVFNSKVQKVLYNVQIFVLKYVFHNGAVDTLDLNFIYLYFIFIFYIAKSHPVIFFINIFRLCFFQKKFEEEIFIHNADKN